MKKLRCTTCLSEEDILFPTKANFHICSDCYESYLYAENRIDIKYSRLMKLMLNCGYCNNRIPRALVTTDDKDGNLLKAELQCFDCKKTEELMLNALR